MAVASYLINNALHLDRWSAATANDVALSCVVLNLTHFFVEPQFFRTIMTLRTVVLLTAFINVYAGWESFRGYQMLQVMPLKGAHLVALRHLENLYPLELPNRAGWGLNFLDPPQELGRKLTVLLPPKLRRRVRAHLVRERVPFHTRALSLEKLVREEKQANLHELNKHERFSRATHGGRRHKHRSYLRFDRILQQLEIYKVCVDYRLKHHW